MPLGPEYGETLVAGDEAAFLTPEALEILGDRVRRADLYDLEQQIQEQVADEWWSTLLNWNVPIRDLLDDHFVRELHRRLYAPVWAWGGRQRSLETNIGIAPEQIAVHADLVRIHPFVDGNGCVTRLLAELVFLATQSGLEPLLTYDWNIDRAAYIQLLRAYDRTRDPTALAELIPAISIEDASFE